MGGQGGGGGHGKYPIVQEGYSSTFWFIFVVCFLSGLVFGFGVYNLWHQCPPERTSSQQVEKLPSLEKAPARETITHELRLCANTLEHHYVLMPESPKFAYLIQISECCIKGTKEHCLQTSSPTITHLRKPISSPIPKQKIKFK